MIKDKIVKMCGWYVVGCVSFRSYKEAVDYVRLGMDDISFRR